MTRGAGKRPRGVASADWQTHPAGGGLQRNIREKAVTAHEVVASAQRRRVLIVEDDGRIRSMLFAFLTSMRCECAAATRRDAPAFLGRKLFDAVVVGYGRSKTSTNQLLLTLRKLRPGLMGRIIMITGAAADQPRETAGDTWAHSHIREDRLFQQLWVNLQSLFAAPDLPGALPHRERELRLVFDSFWHQSPQGLHVVINAARHLVYEYGDIFVDLLIGPLPKSGSVEVVGQVLEGSPWKTKPANLPVVLVNKGGPIAYASTNQLGEFHIELTPEDHLAVRVRVGPEVWIETPLRELAWARRHISG